MYVVVSLENLKKKKKFILPIDEKSGRYILGGSWAGPDQIPSSSRSSPKQLPRSSPKQVPVKSWAGPDQVLGGSRASPKRVSIKSRAGSG
jgi:hypothetical protein